MTTAAARPRRLFLPLRLLRLLRDLLVGGLLCVTPLTALLALGWLTRHMAAVADRARGRPAAAPGWIMGPRGQGWAALLLGGFAANIRAGLLTAAGLGLWTLPFGVLWLGAWWAGWENSFNKGYEQAFVGPAVWFTATLVALPILAHLPIALAHGAAEGRLAAFVEVRRIRRLARAAGWRLPALALVSAILALPFMAARALPVFVEGLVPGFAEMSPAAQLEVAGRADLAAALYAFAALLVLRTLAARIYAGALRRAAAGRLPVRLVSILWLGLAMALWAGVVVQIVVAQFMNYDGALWLTHPFTLLPWPG